MSYPTEPKKLSIQDRIVQVLADVVAGDAYFYTPKVLGKKTHWKEQLADIEYAVFFAGSEESPVHRSGHQIAETFTIVVGGIVRSQGDEAQKMIARCLRDVRVAVFADMEAGTADSLGPLCDSIALGPWTSEPGQETQESFGKFTQNFIVTTSGLMEVL